MSLGRVVISAFLVPFTFAAGSLSLLAEFQVHQMLIPFLGVMQSHTCEHVGQPAPIYRRACVDVGSK